MRISKFSLPEIIFGRGSLKYAGLCARRLGAEKVLLVSDHGLKNAGWVDQLIHVIEEEGLSWVYYDNVVSNPRDFQVEKGATFYREQNADVVIGLGGGSAMDAAKGIALVASNGGQIHDYEGANRIHNPLPPMVFIPTTAGSGSDVSQFAIITDTTRNVKISIISRTLVPNISIIDPQILETKTRELIIAAAIDALSHAVEAYVSKIASPFTEVQSLKAIELVVQHLPTAAENLSPDSLEQLSIASTAAAMAFSNASLGADHALAHSLGGMFDVLHGMVHPILLAEVMRFNLDFCQPKMAAIGAILLGKSYSSDRETALAGIARLEEFCDLLGVAGRLRDIVPAREKLTAMCHMASQDACLLTNPRPATTTDLQGICSEAW